MRTWKESFTILWADDDPDDLAIGKEALEESNLCRDLRFVEDGEELMDYLYRRGKYGDRALSPRPSLILLDLNMPRKDGRVALEEIKSDPKLRQIPVVVMTTSKSEDDICRTYDLGVNSFISKPVTYESLVEGMKMVTSYWAEIVELPTGKNGDSNG